MIVFRVGLLLLLLLLLQIPGTAIRLGDDNATSIVRRRAPCFPPWSVDKNGEEVREKP
jgi:hypothetical protein